MPICKHSHHHSLIIVSFVVIITLSACQAQNGLQRPNSAVQTSNGEIYVLDFGNQRIVKLDARGKLLSQFGGLGDAPNKIFRGWDLTVGPDGNLYLANFVEDDIRLLHDEIKVFRPDGKFITEIGRVDYKPGSTEGDDTYKPYGLAFDNRGNLYTADYHRGTVRVFKTDGTFLTTLFDNLPSDQGYVGLNDIAIDDKNGFFYALDFDGNRLDRYKLSYEPDDIPTVSFDQTIATYGHGQQEIGFPQYLCVDESSGRVFVGDTGNRRVQVFDYTGSQIFSIEAPDVQEWQIMGVSIGSDGNLFVTDAYNSTVWVFTNDGDFLMRLEVNP